MESSKLKHKPEELEIWLLGLRERFNGRSVAVCLELTLSPIVSVLLRHEFVTVFPVNPQTLARYREAWAPSGAKGHQAALRALAFKWVRVLFRCWQTGEPYDESRYLKALSRRGAPLLLAPEKSTTQA